MHRQILHFSNDVSRSKIESAFEKLNLLNPDCNIEVVKERIEPKNVKEFIEDSDFVIEGSDNLPTKMLINDACINLEIPFTIAGVLRFHGQIMTVVPERKTTCYRCIFGDVTDAPSGMSCSQAGVMGPVPGILGCMEANEAMKYLLDIGELIVNRILYVDLLLDRFSFIDVYRNDDCIACGDNALDLVKITDYGIDRACQ